MSRRNDKPALRVFDVPLAIGVALSVIYYAIILQPAFSDTLLALYTTKHLVVYVVVTFFLWGMTDIVFHIARFPREFAALRGPWLNRINGREPVSRAANYLHWLDQLPSWRRHSRIGQRYQQALQELDAKGTTQGFDDYLRFLGDMDYEQTQANYALLRFQCWVMPMFGFLGTVIHFGTALSGHSATSISDNLPHVMAEMGTAFNTTTVALIGATTMMFGVFLCERVERGILQAVDVKINEELANRFQRTDVAMSPFLDALQLTHDEYLAAVRAAAETHTDAWSEALSRFESRCEARDAERHHAFVTLLETFDRAQRQHCETFEPAVLKLTACHADLERLVTQFDQALSGRGDLLRLQAQLAENLRLLRETGSIDQALHGLTGAIHLLTARGSGGRENQAA